MPYPLGYGGVRVRAPQLGSSVLLRSSPSYGALTSSPDALRRSYTGRSASGGTNLVGWREEAGRNPENCPMPVAVGLVEAGGASTAAGGTRRRGCDPRFISQHTALSSERQQIQLSFAWGGEASNLQAYGWLSSACQRLLWSRCHPVVTGPGCARRAPRVPDPGPRSVLCGWPGTVAGSVSRIWSGAWLPAAINPYESQLYAPLRWGVNTFFVPSSRFFLESDI